MVNGTMLQFFHWYYPKEGTLWEELAEKAAQLVAMGVTSVWLPPAFKAAEGKDSVGYDVYDIYDLGEFDQKGTIRTKYGTKEQYVSAVNAAREKGLRVYVDVILNHMGGGDKTEKVRVIQVDEEDRNKMVQQPTEIEAYTRFTFPGRKGKYDDFEWNSSCFTGVDYAADKKQKGIFSIINEYGHDWEDVVDDNEKGNFDFLMFNDIEFRNPKVRDAFKRWGKWYYDTCPFDGVRLDAIKHITPHFLNEWIDFMRNEVNRDLFIVGEYWSGDIGLLHRFQEATGCRMSLFDASLHHNFYEASKQGKDYNLACIFENSLLHAQPMLTVTLVDNHDTQPFQAMEATVEDWFKPMAYALTLLRKDGYPCVFYPDLFGASYSVKDENGKTKKATLNKCMHLEALLKLRQQNAYGNQRDYFDHPSCVGWTREGDEKHDGCAVIISNDEPGNKTMEIGSRYAGKTFIDVLRNRAETITIDESGWANFLVNAASVSVWVAKD